MDGWKDGRADVRTDGRMDVRTNGLTNEEEKESCLMEGSPTADLQTVS